jgi:hypothetical protein
VEYASMAFFVAFVCGLSKWILNRKKEKCATEPAQGGDMAVAVAPAHSDGGK